MRNKILLIVQASLMYTSNILVLLAIFLGDKVISMDDAANIFLTGFLTGIAVFIYSIVTIILYIKDAFKKDLESPSTVVMIIKIALIPYYISNFVIWGAMVLGSLNPFMFIAIPFILLISVTSTYTDMIVTSIPNSAYCISLLREKKIKFSALLLFLNILHYIFCVDFIGSIILNAKLNKDTK